MWTKVVAGLAVALFYLGVFIYAIVSLPQQEVGQETTGVIIVLVFANFGLVLLTYKSVKWVVGFRDVKHEQTDR